MSSRKMSQLEKFDRKWSKTQKYETIVMDRRKPEESPIQINHEEELMEKGNLKEAAAVFSLEGMTTFLDMFQTSMDKAVKGALANGIQQMVQDAVDNRMSEVLEGMTEGIKRFAESQLIKVPQMVEQSIQQVVMSQTQMTVSETNNTDENAATLAPINPVPYNVANIKILATSKEVIEEQIPSIVKILDDNFKGKKFKASEVNNLLKIRHSVMWMATDISKVLQRLPKFGINVEVIQRGVYKYEPTTVSIPGDNSEKAN